MLARPQSLMAPRWRGERGRLEVWYTTITDPRTGTGVWIHHELVAPTTGPPARCHGWIALFPPDAPPVVERFESAALDTGIEMGVDGATALVGVSRTHAWRLAQVAAGPPLFTFPAWAWRSSLLPVAQIVPTPSARYTGSISGPDGRIDLVDAPGATARIHSRGHARRWAWLHADLDADSVLEIVSGVSAHGPLRHLPPMTFLRLRSGGVVWPSADSQLCVPAFRTRLGFPRWSVSGRIGRTRLRADITLDPARTLDIEYAGPDGRRATCRNSERADATVVVERKVRGSWVPRRTGHLAGTAHAEVGRENVP